MFLPNVWFLINSADVFLPHHHASHCHFLIQCTLWVGDAQGLKWSQLLPERGDSHNPLRPRIWLQENIFLIIYSCSQIKYHKDRVCSVCLLPDRYWEKLLHLRKQRCQRQARLLWDPPTAPGRPASLHGSDTASWRPTQVISFVSS